MTLNWFGVAEQVMLEADMIVLFSTGLIDPCLTSGFKSEIRIRIRTVRFGDWERR
jgi:hypothetical protein